MTETHGNQWKLDKGKESAVGGGTGGEDTRRNESQSAVETPAGTEDIALRWAASRLKVRSLKHHSASLKRSKSTR
ncbi:MULTISPECIES: hypothetical protein [unclassified Imperialibacter]|uniref:hypothetical protein n=1 Tax=unclassified Imperialibacter TaxID=2629706 RepID=UPI001251A2B0|nr:MULTISPECIES: hypothetical protein [unclassified Imperialibacter]CAD5257383.1 hypothetical protein IMPERIA89_240091 [Imperialibacter sp. 89]CAD5272372.1 hypothetical protein IMPERIA75_390091 [Imperialibacter sp. 75]VVT32119.1 hypothetical protein IMPR6_60028 [Imperialibacter sp. EC-SDR9]